MEKVYIVFQDNGYSCEDYDYDIVKIFSSREKAENFKKTYIPKEDVNCDYKPKVWVNEYIVE